MSRLFIEALNESLLTRQLNTVCIKLHKETLIESEFPAVQGRTAKINDFEAR